MKRSVSIFKDIISNSSDAKSQRNRLVFWISIPLAGIFLYLALRGLDWGAFTSILRNANYFYVPIIFLWVSLTGWFRAHRWQTLLSAERKIPTKKVFWANMAGYLGNNILPARAGELIRAMYVGKENELSVSFTLATGLVERFMDLIAIVIIGTVSLAASEIVSEQLQDGLKVMITVAIVGLGGILAAPYIGNRAILFISSLPVVRPSVREKVEGILKQFLSGIEALHHPLRAAIFILLTSVIWAMDGIGIVIIAQSLHIKITLTQSLLLLASLGLSSAIPSTPGYVGIYQFVTKVVLQAFSISSANALALIIFLQIVNFLTVAIWGWIGVTRTSFFLQKRK